MPASSPCTWTRWKLWISTSASKVGGARRSRTVFCVPRRRASSSPSVTDSIAADEIGERGVLHQVGERVPVRRPDQLHAPLGDRPRGLGLALGPDLVDHDDLGMWFSTASIITRAGVRAGHLHAPGAADGVVRDVAVAGDLVRGVDDHHAPLQIVGQDPRQLAEHRRLADAGAAEEQDAPPVLRQVLDAPGRAGDRAPDAAGQPDDRSAAVADRRDAVERPRMPARLSSPNSETDPTTWSMSSAVTSSASKTTSRVA